MGPCFYTTNPIKYGVSIIQWKLNNTQWVLDGHSTLSGIGGVNLPWVTLFTVTRYHRDISADPDEVTSYREWIENHSDEKCLKIIVRDELEIVCRNDFVNRCSVLLDIIQEEGNLSLLQPPFLKV